MDWLDEGTRDALLMEGVTRGDPDAARLLLDLNVNAVYGLLRMTLDAAQADDALCATFAEAVDQATEFPAGGAVTAERWLREIALEHLTLSWSTPGGGVSLDGFEGREASLESGWSELVSDDQLMALIRSLEIRRRQVLVLSLLRNLPDREVARHVGVREAQVPLLQLDAVADLRDILAARQRQRRVWGKHPWGSPFRQNQGRTPGSQHRRRGTTTAHHLRPRAGPRTGGAIVIRGTTAQVVEIQNGFAHMARQALNRLRTTLGFPPPTPPQADSGTGGPGRLEAPPPTPTVRPIPPPRRTRGASHQRVPTRTAGTMTMRSPQRTPSTETFELPRRPSF